MTKVWRELYRALHGRRYRHNSYLWPHIRIRRNPRGNITGISAAGRAIPLTPIDQVFKEGARDFHIILSGPSISNIDYAHLPDLQTIGVNGSICLQDKFDLSFPYYCLVDESFVRMRPNLVERVVCTHERTLFLTPTVLRFMLECVPIRQIRCRLCVIENIAEPAYQASPAASTLARMQQDGSDLAVFNTAMPLGFSFEPRLGWFDADTVAYTALQVAVWGAARRIYFHGLDISNAAANGRFYERGEQRLGTRLERHFAKWIEPSFRQAIPLLHARGIEVFNLSEHSALDNSVIPYLDWHKLAR